MTDHKRIRIELITGGDLDSAAMKIAELAASDEHEDPAVWMARLMSLCAVQEHIEHMFENSDAKTYERIVNAAGEAMLADPDSVMPGLTPERCGLALRAAMAVAMNLAVEIERLMSPGERSMPPGERSMPTNDPPMGPRPAAAQESYKDIAAKWQAGNVEDPDPDEEVDA